MSSGSAQGAGPRFLSYSPAGGVASSHVAQNGHTIDDCPAREQKDSYTFLQQEVRRLQRQNVSLEKELQEQHANYSQLTSDMLRICDELRRLLDERDRERAHDVRGTGPQNLSEVLRNRQDVE